MKYLRSYPWGMQLLLFLLMEITFLGFFGVVISQLLPKFTGVSYEYLSKIDEHTPRSIVTIFLYLQGGFNLLLFCCSALLFAYWSHPRPVQFLGLRKPGKPIQPILAIFVMLGAMPVLAAIATLIGKIDFGTSVKAAQAANDQIMGAFLTIHNFPDFLLAFFVMAIIPAIGEELFFRGVLMRFAKQRSPDMVLPILFTAVVFAYTHSNIYGYLSIFLAGVLLAVIYNLTGSIWCSIVAHLCFNGAQVVAAYVAGSASALDDKTISYPLVIGGLVVFGISFYLLLKNKTPLQANWSDNFTAKELSENEY